MIAEEEDFIVLCFLGGWCAVCSSLLVDSQRWCRNFALLKPGTKKLARLSLQVETRESKGTGRRPHRHILRLRYTYL
jgi:hypothetical protein